MGPACAVVDAREDGATLWTGSQKPHFTRDGVARALGLPQEKVHGIWVPGPGSYGRNDAGVAGIDAALLSKAVGRPVRVQGMRYEGHGWDPQGPGLDPPRPRRTRPGWCRDRLRLREQRLVAHRHRHQRERPEHQPSRRAFGKHPLFDNEAEQLFLRDPYGNMIELDQVDKCRCRAANRR